jgi:hypothetical protein
MYAREIYWACRESIDHLKAHEELAELEGVEQ